MKHDLSLTFAKGLIDFHIQEFLIARIRSDQFTRWTLITIRLQSRCFATDSGYFQAQYYSSKFCHDDVWSGLREALPSSTKRGQSELHFGAHFRSTERCQIFEPYQTSLLRNIEKMSPRLKITKIILSLKSTLDWWLSCWYVNCSFSLHFARE